MLYDFSKFDATAVVLRIKKQLKQNNKQLVLLIKTLTATKNISWEMLMNPLQKLDQSLSEWGVLAHMHSVADTDEIRTQYMKALPLVDSYYTDIGQNQPLYEQLQRIDTAKLTSDQARQLHLLLQSFDLSGVGLASKQRADFKKISKLLAKQTTQFANNILDSTNAWEMDIIDKKALKGVPQDAQNAFAEQAKKPNNFKLNLRQDGYLSIIRFADDRKLRQKMHQAYSTRASDNFNIDGFDNSALMLSILKNRQKKAELLGFANYAELSVATKMVDSAKEALNFLYEIAEKSRKAAEQEKEVLYNFAKKELKIDNPQPQDTAYASDKLKEKQHQLDAEKLRGYFPLQKTLDGIYAITQKLFGVNFKKVHKTTWDDNVILLQVKQQEKIIGYLYVDLFARANKKGGAWMNDAKGRALIEDELQLPVAYLVCNFSSSKPTLLYHHEVETLLHEFGHCLHHLLTEIDILDIAGINNVEWDAVELPSQLLENWGNSEQSLPLLSEHYQNKQPLPNDLLEAITSTKNFQSALQITRQLEFAIFDLELHMQTKFNANSVKSTWDKVIAKIAVMPHADYERTAHSFAHIFAGGYAAGYYSYLWAEVLSSNVFELFKKDLLSPATGKKYLDSFLSRGASLPAADMFENLCGHKPSSKIFLQSRAIST